MAGLFEWVKSIKRWRRVRIEQVKRSDQQKGFVVLPKRWVVERCVWVAEQAKKALKGLSNVDGNKRSDGLCGNGALDVS